ncbi:MAG: C1 family peptidase [Propionibacteriaceae bacterium]|jgi:bleomycin hydrolase|nr:C1 family peptidase [Propionibacteriaceae bacterium]
MPQSTALDPTAFAALGATLAGDPVVKLVQNAVTTTGVNQVALNRAVVTTTDPSFSVQLDHWKVANQKKSGRCWLFSGLNFLRAHVIDTLKLEGFEFSQAYLHFFDKLEKANWFFTSMIELAGRDLDDRTVKQLLTDPIGDGGQWDMFVSLVQKYGVVPQYAMPESESSSNTKAMNDTLKTLLRRGARDLRAAVAAGQDAEPLRAALMEAVYRVLAIHLGTPPTSFTWQYRDKDRHFTRAGEFTPLEFAAEVIDIDLADYLVLVNDPRATSPYQKTFTVDHLGNVVGGRQIRYLNAPAEFLMEQVVKGLEAGRPVWFGSDCHPQFDRELGLWSGSLFEYEALYGVDLTMTKAERMELAEEAMNHAMVFTGVDLVDGAPRRFRVENSWGDERADKGYDTMNADWFGEHVFEVAVRRDALPEAWQQAADQDPIVLPLWDPMGTLA